MKADLLRQLMRAIAAGSSQDVDRLAEKVVEAERELGHTLLAGELDRILARSKKRDTKRPSAIEGDQTLRELPVNKRHRELLVTFCPREALEHHMVLPPEVEERFQRVEQEYAARERLSVYGLAPRKTVLVYGPPGCGKSLGAKRMAWNVGLPLMKVRFDAIVSSYFGESASNLRAVFEAAQERPCVLLLDECDFIAQSRTRSRDIGEASRIVNTLLQLMEEYTAPGLLVATTNIESSLDSALFRRFDDVFMVPLPGESEIEQLLKMTLSAVPVPPTIEWARLANSLNGASAADVVKVAQNAAKSAVLRGKKVVGEADLSEVIREVRRKQNNDA